MTTYASPRLTRQALLVTITAIFLVGCFMFGLSVLHLINYAQRSTRNQSYGVGINSQGHGSLSGSKPPTPHQSSSINLTELYYRNHMQQTVDDQARFPSTAAPSVEIIFGLVTVGQATFGIVAITKQYVQLLSTYGYVLVISCFVKLIFVIVSAGMQTILPGQNFLSTVASLGMITATCELILVMCVCQFSKLVKRGDAARQEIQSIHSYHLERRSRSRSQSRMRSFYNIPQSMSPTHSISRACSYQNLSTDTTENTSCYVSPSIYLKLDR